MNQRLAWMLAVNLTTFPLMAGEPMLEIIGHRGASYEAPENTLASIQLAWEQHADAVEFDVYLSRDGQIVLIHDKDTERTGGLKKGVVEQTADELRQLDVGRWKDPRYTGERIPLLSEALATIPTDKRVFIEVKCGPEIVPELKRVLAASRKPAAATAIISFQAPVIAACKQALPQCKAYWIVGLKRDKVTGEWPHTAASLIKTAKELHADGLDLQAVELIDRPFGEAIRQAGLELCVWTVNDVRLARAMLAAGVQGITTDRPGWLRAELAKTP